MKKQFKFTIISLILISSIALGMNKKRKITSEENTEKVAHENLIRYLALEPHIEQIKPLVNNNNNDPNETILNNVASNPTIFNFVQDQLKKQGIHLNPQNKYTQWVAKIFGEEQAQVKYNKHDNSNMSYSAKPIQSITTYDDSE